MSKGNPLDKPKVSKTVHGREPRNVRVERKLAVKRLADLETAARGLGIITGPKTRGRRPR